MADEKSDAAPAEIDNRVRWIESRTQSTYKHLKGDKFKKAFTAKDNIRIIMEFLDTPDIRCLFFFNDSVTAAHGLPKKAPDGKKVVYFLKAKAGKLEEASLVTDVLVGEILPEPLQHLEKVIQEVYLPLLSNPSNQEGWGEVASREIMDKLHAFLANVSITLGQTEGRTCLPLPLMDSGPSSSSNKDRIHLLEGAVITWTKQIKNVLKQDPEGLLKQGLHPTPDVEIDFWKAKAANLNSIFEQLQGERIRKVLRFLDQSKSTYCTPFAKLCKEVFTARLEANDNVKFLRTLEKWFDDLKTFDDFPQLMTLFKPMMHIILLIWKNSKHYNTPARLVVLMREICNALINQACRYLSGDQIFELIAEEKAGRAVEQLKTTLKVCGTFKSTYFDYKATANAECPINPWRIQNNALFMRLDSFLERCHDILDLTQTIVQFTKLAKIEIGGTKGKTLTTSVQQIYADFQAAVSSFQNVQYDIMDVGAKQFDDDFYEFRCRIKELERRLGSVLTQGFDDCSTIYGRFKLLDSFEGLLDRPIIQDELEKKHIALVQSYGHDLKTVQELFLTHRECPPISWNLPPIAGSIGWCRGLMERIREPMEKLRQLNRTIMEREEAKEVAKVYANILSSLEEYITIKIEEWGADVESTSQAKLKLPLLRRDPDTWLLRVNFDPALVRLLREVKYFLLLELDVPESALFIYKKAEVFRRETGNLDLIVNMYNNMMTSLLPVEAPLVRNHLEKIDKTVERGVSVMNWKSHGIDLFITESMACVRTADGVLSTLKANLKSIEEILQSWSKLPLLQRKNKPVPPDEFEQGHKLLKIQRYNEIQEGGRQIHTLLKNSNKVLKVSQGLPDWKAYVDFLNNIVVEGLVGVVVVSLTYLLKQIDPEEIAKVDRLPVLEINLDLYGKDVMFMPDIFETANRTGVRDIVNSWVESFFHVATIFKRLDSNSGSYIKELQENCEICALLARLNETMSLTEQQCVKYRQQYKEYAYLWTTDLSTMFQEFIAGATSTVTESGRPVLDLRQFDESITKFRNVQAVVAELRTPIDIGWLRINSQPIKQALGTWVTKWVFMYTQHLHDDVRNKLSQLHSIITRVEAGLQEEVTSSDKAALRRVMSYIRDVRKGMDETQEMFAPLRDTVALLKQHNISMEGTLVDGTMEEVLEYLESAPLKWDSLVNHTFKKKEEILPLQNAEVENIKDDLAKFQTSMKAFRADFRSNAPFEFSGSTDEAYKLLDNYENALCEKEAAAAHLNELEELFELPISVYSETTDSRREMRLLKDLWDFRALIEKTFADWKGELWSTINTQLLEERTRSLQKSITGMGSANTVVKGWLVYKKSVDTVKNMGTVLPLVDQLHSPAMRDRHWKSLSSVCHSRPVDVRNPKFCLEDLLDLQLHKHADDVSEIVETASKELKVDKKLQGIEETWTSLQLEFVSHKDAETRIVKPPDVVMESLEQHQLELQTMIGMGKFVDYFRDRVTQWQRTLGNVEASLKEWTSVTKQWASLEAIFLGSVDIRSQLPDDTKRFEGIDQEFKNLMKEAVETPNVVESCTKPGRWELLRDMTTELEKCQKSLNEYLDMKKKIFPRFYFVSNVALLDILSNGNNPPLIMPHIGDCYDSISNLVFEEGSIVRAHSMVAKDGEVVEFPQSFVIQGAVETWLNSLTRAMQDCLRSVLEQGVDTAVHWDVEKPRHKWLFDYPAQVVLQATQLFWTEETEGALEEFEGGTEDAVAKSLQTCNTRLEDLINLVKTPLDKADRTKVIALITMDVHSRDVVTRLVKERTEGPSSFLWQQQLRFYWDPESKDVDVRICDFKTKYSYEYIGNRDRLVITPLTDRCYITLTTALRLMLGGAPAGPAGTGKTETTKDLARALALPCYVFNCSEQMNFQSLADIFKGLSQTGGWGCFDEFNRIPIEVLSVVATQVKTVLDSIVLYSIPANRDQSYANLPAGTPPCKVGEFDFMGDVISLVPTVGFYITMNPGYAGRTELPENLKALFRSCAMIRPDLALICENMLMAEGFVKARPLSVKFVTLYSLSSELLSQQPHYDWGLRAVKSVLRVAGMLRRKSPEMDEEPILMRALRDFNTPKIPQVDTSIFLRLVKDLFPAHADNTPPVQDDKLRNRCIEVCKNLGLQHDEGFVVKVIQFQELLDVRHSVMLIGPAGCGKTTIWSTLAACHNHGLKKRVCVPETVNPKAVTSNELYGYMTLSKDWKDGVLSIIMRGMSKNYRDLGFHNYQTHKWVVLDGDIDAVWIESMNTVMDDNKVLTLVSNERIPLSDSMRMLFEINSLKNATPATVSRAGILYVNETDIGWRPFVESWVMKREHESELSHIPRLFDKYIDPLADSLKKGYKTMVPIRLANSVSSVCYLMEGLLIDVPPEKKTPETLEALFVLACCWAFGGPMPVDKSGDYRKQFDNMWKTAFTAVKFPKEGTVFDYMYDHNSCAWVPWADEVPEYVPVPIGSGSGEVQFSSLVVSTSDTVRLTYLLDRLVKRSRPVMLVGTAGTGKTTILSDYLRSLEDDRLSAVINMNYYTDSRALQTQIEGNIDKRSGRIFGPPSNKTLLYFVDDLNLPYVEEYGTQNSLALLRQYFDYHTFFDRNDLGFKKELVDVSFVSAMNPTAGSFTINQRLQRHFVTFACMMPGSEDLTTIYASILEGHLLGFNQGVVALGSRVVDATISLHQQVVDKFLPSAVKFVYNWNMRELSNVFQGMCLSRSDYYPNNVKFVRLWLHECQRVFGDRLVNEADSNRFSDLLVECSKRFFEEPQEEVHVTPNLFTSFVTTTGEPTYLPVQDFEQLSNVLENKLSEYNDSNSIMDLVLFEQAMEHICRITRIIQNPCGCAMLVGVGGSGKQSLSRLSAFICGYKVKQLSVTNSFTVIDLKEKLKDMYTDAGVRGNPLMFLLTDSQIVDDKFLVYVNDVLSSGWIPELFARDEMDNIFSALRTEAKAAAVQDTPEAMTEFFISRVRQNLHLVLCFSPVGDLFRLRARRFPGLINCTSIDWFHPWPRDALVSVAATFLQNVELNDEETKENCSHHMAEVHLSVKEASLKYAAVQRRYNYVTPKSFLDLISFYKDMLASKRAQGAAQVARLDTGLTTLRKTANDVSDLQVDLKHTMVKVEEKKKSTDALLVQMGKQRGEAETQSANAAIENEKATAAAERANAIQEQASQELAAAKPAMIAAGEAVNCLNKNSLTELRNFSKLPSGVELVTKAVLMMVENEFKNFKWDRAKKMMAKVDVFLEKLKSYDAENMDEKLISMLQPIIENPVMNYEVMKQKSVAAANLANWVINIYTYNRIYVQVKPLMETAAEASAAKAAAEAEQQKVEQMVQEVNKRLKTLQETFLEATNEKAKVEAEAQGCLDRLGLAERLTGGLSSENERWGREIEKLRENQNTLIGDVLLAAAFVSYIGAFDAAFREELWQKEWIPDMLSREIPLTEGVDPLDMLTDDGRNARMMGEGLPADRISIENGAVVSCCKRWPLIIDPQLQGIKWLRKREADNDLLVMQLTQNDWQRQMEHAISQGFTVILENCSDELDTTLEPVLTRSVYKKGRNFFLRLGGEEVEYDPKFKLYLQTKLSNPHFKPEVAAQCTLINFIATERGLEDQLLAKVVNVERPELEAKKAALSEAFNNYKIQLLELENNLLERLANAPEDILQDVPLIEGLEATKAAVVDIGLAVDKGKDAEIAINEAREVYRPVAAEAAMLYFMLTKMDVINHMYQYSLDSFTMFFFKAIDRAVAAESLTQRVHNLRDCLRFTIFTWVSRGLFEEHKLIFLTELTLNLMRRNILRDELNAVHCSFLLRGPKKLNIDNPISWLPNPNWASVCALGELEEFSRFPSDLEEAAPRFKEWYNHVTPESEKLPLDWAALDKTPFLKLLVLRCLRPDRMNSAITNFVRYELPDGDKYTDCDATLNSVQILEQALEDSSPTTPIYFILSPGADVVADVDRMALKFGFEKGSTYHNVSMGQGQDVIAMEKLEMGHKQGHWVILNNVHLMPNWLLKLEKKLDQFAREGSQERFRVFLSSDPSKNIPIGVLSRCIKLTNEPPMGLKANLKRAFCSFSKSYINEADSKLKSILFGLCHFHSVMMERKKFGPKGFNMMYPFSLGDLRDSAVCLQNYLENAPVKIPWPDLKYIFGEIMYGGHIVNDFDRTLCKTYLDWFMREELLDEMELFPFAEDERGVSFKSPSPTTYERYLEHIELELKGETTLAFGLHPNAEIGFRTEQSNRLFRTIMELQPRSQGAGDGGLSPQHVAENCLNDVLDRFGETRFDVDEMELDNRGPFQNVFIQECEAMNKLLGEMSRSLHELNLGFAGELTISDSMEALTEALFLDRVPTTWEKLAWPSTRPLQLWLHNLAQRLQQLQDWFAAPMEIPRVTWISGLINPQSFLTAIKQRTAQAQKAELDKLVITTDVTKRMLEECDSGSRDGAYIHGLSLEGARWDIAANIVEKARPKEMFCAMPVINCKAVSNEKAEGSGVFQCPVYKTSQRGPTFVFQAQLKTKSPPARWVLAGVALIMDLVE